MRLAPLFAVAALGFATAAAAAPRVAPAPQPLTGPTDTAAAPVVLPNDLRTMEEGRAEAAATAAKLASMDAEQEADEARMTQLRDWDLNLQNARIRAIQPVLRFGHNPSLPHY